MTNFALEKIRTVQNLNAPYIVIEGISGSGKTTQLAMLGDRYQQAGIMPVLLHEPTPWFSERRKAFDVAVWDTTLQVMLLLMDRYVNVRAMVESARTASHPIIAARSYLSTMVYQASDHDPSNWLSAAHIPDLHRIIPQPDYIFLLTLDPQEAYRRISLRNEASHDVLGDHETLDQLIQHSQKFLALQSYFPQMRLIDAHEGDPVKIHEQIWSILNPRA